MNRWTVHVTDFGKIKKADVQVAPFTLFLGDNNSGKSYMMTLIYGLLNARFFFDRFPFCEETGAYIECRRILDRMLNRVSKTEAIEYALTAEEQKSFQNLLNEILERNKEEFLKTLFNREIQMGQLSVAFPELEECRFDLRYSERQNTGEDKDYITMCGVRPDNRLLSGYRVPQDFRVDGIGPYNFFLAYIMETMLRMDFRGGGNDRVVYFPTARTGFLLTYKTLAGSAIKDKFNFQEEDRKEDKNFLTKPNSDFLTGLSSMGMQTVRGKYRNIVEFIENDIISGQISTVDLPSHDILYTPRGSKKALPMFVSSGVVTEITPLLLFLRYADLGTVMIEEPEISLHLELQWAIARVLIRMMNMGVPVFATTHSDIILQHINNMITLKKSPDAGNLLNELGYDESDLLFSEHAAVYQFDIQEDQRTEVKKLPCGDYGFEAMTFYHTLEKMTDQIKKLDSMEE